MKRGTVLFDIRVRMLDVDPTRGAFAIVLQDSEGGIECPIEAYMNTVDAPMDDLRIKMAFGDIRDAVIEVMRKHSEDGSIVYRNKNKTYVSRKRQ